MRCTGFNFGAARVPQVLAVAEPPAGEGGA